MRTLSVARYSLTPVACCTGGSSARSFSSAWRLRSAVTRSGSPGNGLCGGGLASAVDWASRQIESAWSIQLLSS